MLSEIDIYKILFIDIETVPQYSSFEDVPERVKLLWDKKSLYFRDDEQDAESVYQRAAIYAEFGKIICISAGIIIKEKNMPGLRIKSYFGDDEKKILLDFSAMLTEYSSGKTYYLCAHNGKEFDFPYLSRRMLIRNIVLPGILDNAGKKPWEVRHLDTMELWKFGDYKHYTSLDLLATIFDIPSPKIEMDGSMVADTYWKENDMQRIKEYCQSDVVAIVQLMMRYKNLPLIETERIEFVYG